MLYSGQRDLRGHYGGKGLPYEFRKLDFSNAFDFFHKCIY